jgi:Glycosyltransferase family 17
MTRTWDCIMLRDELEMLECRLRELDGKVWRHVIVESPRTHRGDPKPLHYMDNRERFAPWADRIVHIVADVPAHPDPWAREHSQRDAALRGLTDAAPDDMVLIADVDEIPSADALKARPDTAAALSMRLAMYAVDLLYPERHLCPVIARAGAIGPSLASARDARYSLPAVADGGWHLTWLGGVEGQREKLRVTCHTEMTVYEHDLLYDGKCYNDGIHHSGQLQMIPVDVDETWPKWIYERKCPQNWFRPRVAASSGQ